LYLTAFTLVESDTKSAAHADVAATPAQTPASARMRFRALNSTTLAQTPVS
jgi:hypothetical protein